MQLTCRILKDVQGVNSFGYAQAAEFSEGDTEPVYFQLVDLSKDRSLEGFMPSGRRYIPAAGAELEVTLDHIDDAKVITRAATQPYDQDPSIWRLEILPTDVIRGTVTMRLVLTEGSRTINGKLMPALLVTAVE